MYRIDNIQNDQINIYKTEGDSVIVNNINNFFSKN
jgi:hypothetical protein